MCLLGEDAGIGLIEKLGWEALVVVRQGEDESEPRVRKTRDFPKMEGLD